MNHTGYVSHLLGRSVRRRVPAGARARPFRLVAAAVAAASCLALTGFAQQVPAREAVPSPQAPVIHYLAHPVGPLPAPTTNSNKVYLLCLTSAPTHCAALDSADTIIVVTALITTICQFVDCPELLRTITGSGSDQDKGTVTFQVEGAYHSANTNFLHDCLGANPTTSDQHDNVYFSVPSRCFGVLQESWKYTRDSGSGFRYDLLNRQAEHLHRVYAMANLNLRQGAFLYVKPNIQPGLWTTWGLYQVGTCGPC